MIEGEKESLKEEATHLIEEARMVLPGIQALFGFQFVAIFNTAFTELPRAHQLLHLAALLLVAMATILIMTPAAYHRIAERGMVSRRFVQLGSACIAAAMSPLAVAVALDTFIVSNRILDQAGISALIAGALLAVFLAMWYGLPMTARNRLGRRQVA